MTRVSDSGFEVTGKTTFICDYSPPRSGNALDISTPVPDADFLLVNRNPGRSVRADSAMLAAALQQQTGRDVIFALLTRDMNRLAIQSYLLGAQLLGLENVVLARGDAFSGRDAERVQDVSDYRSTELIAAISEMNLGRDFRGRQLTSPTAFCAGATLDTGRDLHSQARLVQRKAGAGAQFLVTQPIFTPADADRFHEIYLKEIGEVCQIPIYWGLQMLEAGSISFGATPPPTRRELEAGRSGVEIAVELYERFREASIRNIYLLPPIRRRGERDYVAAQAFLERGRALG